MRRRKTTDHVASDPTSPTSSKPTSHKPTMRKSRKKKYKQKHAADTSSRSTKNYFYNHRKKEINVTVVRGVEIAQSPPVLHNASLRNSVFLGQCYVCGTPGHSSRYCPLRKCILCETRCAGFCLRSSNNKSK